MTTATLRRPAAVPVVRDQVRYAVTDYWRARVVAVLSFLFPLAWLLLIGAMAGNEVLNEATGLRVMQFATPGALVMGALYATLPTMAITVTEARETGVLKRLRGTPLPTWAYLTGRAVAASVFALAAVLATLALAVAVYDVQVLGRTVPAAVGTLALAVVCFVALGLGVSALCRTTAVAQAVSIGGVVVLSFVSGHFTVGGTLPEAVTRVADVLPVRPLTEALQAQFNPSRTGSGWDLGALATLLLWAVAGAAVAVWGLRRQDVAGRRAASAPARAAASPSLQPLRAQAGRPGTAELLAAQTVAAIKAMWRDPGAVFFAVVLPVGLFALVGATGAAATTADGVPLTVHLAAGMIAWGVAVTCLMNIPEAVVQARDRGALKRLRGTPLTPAHYVAGRVVAGLVLGVVIAALVLALGAVGYDMPVAGLLPALGVLTLGSVALTACGFLLAAAVRNARSFGAVALMVLLPMSFISDVFSVGGPEWMGTLGSVLPLKHLQNGLADALAGAATTGTWWHAAALVGWALVAGALALRFFRWQARD